MPVTAVSAEVYRLISSPTLPAIPLLTACGYVLAESQASLRLLRFFKSLLGFMPGGLAVIVIAVCALFTAFTGGSGESSRHVGRRLCSGRPWDHGARHHRADRRRRVLRGVALLACR